MISLMKQHPAMVEPAMQCFSATRHIERIADHATNIAEDVASTNRVSIPSVANRQGSVVDMDHILFTHP